MSVTITRIIDGAVTTPTTSTRDVIDESRNIEHDLISGDMAITLVPPRPGAGDLTLVYRSEDAARAAHELHRGRSAFTLVDTMNTARDMTYVLGQGGQRLTHDPSGAWVLVVSYREVVL